MSLLDKLQGRFSPPRTTTLNLLLCGAQRSGTTSLKYYLEEHPEIGFVGEGNTEVDGVRIGFPFASPILAKSILGEDPSVYERICQRHAGKKAYIATKQPYFMVYPQVPFNLRDQLPDVKLLFILRNPVEAVYSTYRKRIRDGKAEGKSFEDFLKTGAEEAEVLNDPRNRGSWPGLLRDPERLPFAVDRGFYYQQIRRFYMLLRREQILVLRFDRFAQDPAGTMRRVLEFLELDPDFEFTRLGEVKNSAPQEAPMATETRKHLQDLFAASNRRLFDLLGWPPDLWD